MQGVRSISCPCQAPAGKPCTPQGDHLARYLRAEASGAITRDQLTAVVAGLIVLAPNVIVEPAALTAGGSNRPPGSRRTRHLTDAGTAACADGCDGQERRRGAHDIC